LDVKRQGHGIGNECKNKVLGTDMKWAEEEILIKLPY
jgi:hypothetical protein